MYILTVKTVLKFISATVRAQKLICNYSICLSIRTSDKCVHAISSALYDGNTTMTRYYILLLLLLTVELLSLACTTQHLDICCACRCCSPRIGRVKNYYLEINSLRMIRITFKRNAIAIDTIVQA